MFECHDNVHGRNSLCTWVPVFILYTYHEAFRFVLYMYVVCTWSKGVGLTCQHLQAVPMALSVYCTCVDAKCSGDGFIQCTDAHVLPVYSSCRLCMCQSNTLSWNRTEDQPEPQSHISQAMFPEVVTFGLAPIEWFQRGSKLALMA